MLLVFFLFLLSFFTELISWAVCLKCESEERKSDNICRAPQLVEPHWSATLAIEHYRGRELLAACGISGLKCLSIPLPLHFSLLFFSFLKKHCVKSKIEMKVLEKKGCLRYSLNIKKNFLHFFLKFVVKIMKSCCFFRNVGTSWQATHVAQRPLWNSTARLKKKCSVEKVR